MRDFLEAWFWISVIGLSVMLGGTGFLFAFVWLAVSGHPIIAAIGAFFTFSGITAFLASR